MKERDIVIEIAIRREKYEGEERKRKERERERGSMRGYERERIYKERQR